MTDFAFEGFECACGKAFKDEVLKEHQKTCLAYMINGMTGRMFYKYSFVPVKPVEYVTTTFTLEDTKD